MNVDSILSQFPMSQWDAIREALTQRDEQWRAMLCQRQLFHDERCAAECRCADGYHLAGIG